MAHHGQLAGQVMQERGEDLGWRGEDEGREAERGGEERGAPVPRVVRAGGRVWGGQTQVQGNKSFYKRKYK